VSTSIGACAVVAGVEGDYLHDPSVFETTSTGSGTGPGAPTGTLTGTPSGTQAGGAGAGGAPVCEPDTDFTADPRHCGACGHECDDTRLCVEGNCVCRPGLTLIGGWCVDTESSDRHCGGEDIECETSSADFCEDGNCVAECSTGREECGDGCFDVSRHHEHCDGCQDRHRCDSWEVCVNGDCSDWIPASSCTACPCALCTGNEDYPTCCSYPGLPTFTICVDGDLCPAP
jgi:hypothetical protein